MRALTVGYSGASQRRYPNLEHARRAWIAAVGQQRVGGGGDCQADTGGVNPSQDTSVPTPAALRATHSLPAPRHLDGAAHQSVARHSSSSTRYDSSHSEPHFSTQSHHVHTAPATARPSAAAATTRPRHVHTVPAARPSAAAAPAPMPPSTSSDEHRTHSSSRHARLPAVATSTRSHHAHTAPAAGPSAAAAPAPMPPSTSSNGHRSHNVSRHARHARRAPPPPPSPSPPPSPLYSPPPSSSASSASTMSASLGESSFYPRISTSLNTAYELASVTRLTWVVVRGRRPGIYDNP